MISGEDYFWILDQKVGVKVTDFLKEAVPWQDNILTLRGDEDVYNLRVYFGNGVF